jgi:hypothetical protein
MIRNRILSIVLIVGMLTLIPVTWAHAAPTPGLTAGTIQSITLVTDPITQVTTAEVVIINASGLAQKVQISLDTAAKLGLVAPSTNVTAGQSVNIPNTDPLNPGFVLSGTVTGFSLVTDPLTGLTSLTLTLTDALNAVHVVSLNLTAALSQGLITININSARIGTAIVIDPSLILGSTVYTKIVTQLGSFFGTSLGVTFDQLAAYHAAGVGYGVLTQALWMSVNLNGNAALLDQILAAKSNHDFSSLVLPGGATAANWGQLRKLAMTDKHQNLGSIISGKATPLTSPTITTTAITNSSPTAHVGNGNGTANGTGNGNGNGNGNGKGNDKGKGNGKGKGPTK